MNVSYYRLHRLVRKIAAHYKIVITKFLVMCLSVAAVFGQSLVKPENSLLKEFSILDTARVLLTGNAGDVKVQGSQTQNKL